MNPEQMAAYQDGQLRQQALMLADKRAPAGATVDEVMASAEKLLAFLKAGMQVADPSPSA